MGGLMAKPEAAPPIARPLKPTQQPAVPTTIPTTLPTTVSTTPTTAAAAPATTVQTVATHATLNQLHSKSTPKFGMTSQDSSTPTTPLLRTSPSMSSPASSPTFSQSPFLLPLTILLSSSFLIVAIVFFTLIYRRKQQLDKHLKSSKGAVHTTSQVRSDSSLSKHDSIDFLPNHIYVEHVETERKLHEELYTYVCKPRALTVGALPRGYAPSKLSAEAVSRGKPDGKSKALHNKGVPSNVFGDEDHYNILFENKPTSALDIVIMNSYENHPTTAEDDYQNSVNIANVQESPKGVPKSPELYLTIPKDSASIRSDTLSVRSASNRDSGHDTASFSSQIGNPSEPGGGTFTEINLNEDQRALNRMSASIDDPEVVITMVEDEVLYENAPRSRASTVRSMLSGEPKYYVLEAPADAGGMHTYDGNGMVENILYQSIIE